MAELKFSASSDTPEVLFSGDSNSLSLIGRSTSENPGVFFKPIYQNLQLVLENAKNFEISVDLSYLNSSSVKLVFAILNCLNEKFLKSPEGDFKVNWHYFENDILMANKGEEFKEFLDLPFNLIPKGKTNH